MENKDGDKGKWCIPKAVQAVVVKDESVTCDNPSLRLAKFVRVGGDGGNKRKELEAVRKCQEKNATAPQLDLPARAECVWGELRSRLAVNLAGGILENANICLHPHFGYPYLPGSAVKGLARHAAWCEWKKLEGEAKQSIARRISTVFGYPTGDKKLDDALKADEEAREAKENHAGCVAFLGAFPEGKANIEVDVLTCHHAKYYSGSKPQVTDDESPNVQAFPVVASGTVFCFPLVPLRRGKSEKEMVDAMEDAQTWLRKAIEVNGAGAKTAAGYGWFGDVLPQKEARYRNRLEAKRVRTRLSALVVRPITAETARELQKRAETLLTEAKALKVDESILQRLRDFQTRCNKAIPKESPLDILRRSWENEKKILKDAKGFPSANAERKEAMLTLFAEAGTLPAQVYAKIRGGVKGFPGGAQKEICEAMEARQGGKA